MKLLYAIHLIHLIFAVDYCFNHPNSGSAAATITHSSTTPVDSATNTNPEQSPSISAVAAE